MIRNIVTCFTLVAALIRGSASPAAEVDLDVAAWTKTLVVGADERWVRRLARAARKPSRRRAQLTTVLDLSGSALRYTHLYPRFHMMVSAVLAETYAEVTGVTTYLGADFRNEVEPRPDFRLTFGGGTNYPRGFYGARTATYLGHDVDHYVLVLGDFEDSLPLRAVADLEYLNARARIVLLVNPGVVGQLQRQIDVFRRELPRFTLVSAHNSRACEHRLR